jgi:hypothetical protein
MNQACGMDEDVPMDELSEIMQDYEFEVKEE